jgi:GTPase
MNTNPDLPLVVIFGRTNVGKSTLFNCLIEKKKALTSDISGTTRDSNTGTVEWNGKSFTLVDTGGIIDLKILSAKKPKVNKQILHTIDIDEKVQERSLDLLSRADLILFVIDAQAGFLDQDREMALAIKKLSIDPKKILLAANKADNPRIISETAEYNKLSLGEPFPVSAASGSGTGDLLDAITDRIKTKIDTRQKNEKPYINIAIVGKPNSGKSSLINSLLGEERVIVSPVPHTTREPQDASIEYKNIIFNLVDTAGITKRSASGARRKNKDNSLEKASVKRSIEAIARSEIVLLVLDITEDIGRQDAKLVDEILKKKSSLIIIANKWDLIEDKDLKHYTEQIYGRLPFVRWAPVQFISALTGKNVNKILDQAIMISEQRKISISENALSKFLSKIIKLHQPVKGKGVKKPYIHKLRLVETDPPFFAVHIGSKDSLDESYLRFIENRMREKFGFIGTPITIYVDKPRKVHGKHETVNN